MKVKPSKKKGHSSSKLDISPKKKLASKISHASRVIAKIPPKGKTTSMRPSKASNKIKQYCLSELTDYFENKFDVCISSEQGMKLAQKKFRNKYLFPAIKEGAVYKRSDLLFDEPDALQYLQMLSRTLDKSDDYYMEEVP